MRCIGLLAACALSLTCAFKPSGLRNCAARNKAELCMAGAPLLKPMQDISLIAASTLFPVATSSNILKGSFVVALVGSFIVWVNKILWTPSRTYEKDKNTVGKEYDAWSSEGILEAYWGEHIHLGYYDDAERKRGYKKKNFIGAKYDFIDKMAEFANLSFSLDAPIKVLDVGCGIGGTSRYLAKKYGSQASVTGITLSPVQAARANQLAQERGIPNAKFEVMDALNMVRSFKKTDLLKPLPSLIS